MSLHCTEHVPPHHLRPHAVYSAKYGPCSVCGMESICLVLEDTPKATSWPKRMQAHIHSNKESMRDLGQKNGLTGAGLDKFMYALYEVSIDLDVNEDGTYKIISTKE